jgi:hypothetical protein
VVGVTGYTKWWLGADAMGAELRPLSDVSVREWYCFGHALLAMDCEDRPFSRRFKNIYGECAVEPIQDETLPRVDFRVAALSSYPGVLAISVTPNLPDGADFLLALAPERRYVECPEITPGWRMLAPTQCPKVPVLAFGPSILVSSSHAWQYVIALYAISTAIRLRPDVYVLHASSLGISGRGVLLSGAKGMGKTTLSLCFASRGHAFLGDEWAAVSSLSGELLPLRRAASIRPGPRPAGLDGYLKRHKCDTEILPDGTQRVRTRVGSVFPRALPQVVPLTDIFFLRRFTPRPMVERFSPSGGELPPISPILASVWGFSPGERAIEMFRTLGKARWWHLDVGGSPDETADLVEETLKKEDLWD